MAGANVSQGEVGEPVAVEITRRHGEKTYPHDIADRQRLE
jgi:hypothetical protein